MVNPYLMESLLKKTLKFHINIKTKKNHHLYGVNYRTSYMKACH